MKMFLLISRNIQLGRSSAGRKVLRGRCITYNCELTITPVEGKIQFFISATETGNITSVYYYDLELIIESQVQRIMQGKITVSEEMIR